MNTDQIVHKLLLNNDLRNKEARQLFSVLLSGRVSPISSKIVLALLHKKQETATELKALIQTARAQNRIRLPKFHFKALCDTCGTGGDGKRTFNISTVAAFIAAGAGVSVAKHGNRSITSRCGSSDLIEALGVNLAAPSRQMIRAIRQAQIGYFHAPYYNHAFLKVQGIRKELGFQKIKTIFNLAGPLLNPMKAKHQVVGVYHQRLIPVILNTFKALGNFHVIVLCGKNGADEILTNQSTRMGELRNRKVRYFTFKPGTYHLRAAGEKLISGGNITKNKMIALNLLTGKDVSARRDVVIANAAFAIYVSGRAKNISQAIKKARVSLASGKAFLAFQGLKRLSHAAN